MFDDSGVPFALTGNMKMQHWMLNLGLVVATLLGGFLAWSTGEERRRLHAEHKRLLAITGDLRIDDPSKVYIRALETHERLDFAWRVHLPEKHRQIWGDSAGDSSTTWSSGSEQFIARVRFRLSEQGLLQIYTRFSGARGWKSVGDRQLAELLRDRWDRIQVLQLGAAETAVLEACQSAVLLRLTLPPELQEEARLRLSPGVHKRHVPVLYELRLGPQPAQP